MELRKNKVINHTPAGEPEKLDKSLFISFSLFLFMCSFSIAAAQLFLGIAVLLKVVISLRHSRYEIPIEYRSILFLVVLFILWEALTSIIGDNQVRSLIDLRGEWLFFAIPVTIYLCKINGFREKLVTSLTSGVLILSIYALIQSITGIDFPDGFLPNENESGYRLVGFFSHPLTFGNYIATASIFITGYTALRYKFLERWKQYLFLTATILSLSVTILSNSRGPLLALLIGLFVLGIMIKKARYPVLILIIIAISRLFLFPQLVDEQIERTQIDFNKNNPSSRLLIWKTSLTIVKEHPLFGVGQSNFGREYSLALPEDINDRYRKGHAHNDLLHIAAISGLPALALYLGIWIVILGRIKRVWLSKREDNLLQAVSFGALLGSIVFLAASMTETLFADEEVRQLLMFIWGIGLVSSGKETPKTAPVRKTT